MNTLTERIEQAFDNAIKYRRLMQYNEWAIQSFEEAVKLEHADEWAGAKNNDVRALLVSQKLEDNEEYEQAREDFERASLEFQVAKLEIDRLRLLVQERAAV